MGRSIGCAWTKYPWVEVPLSEEDDVETRRQEYERCLARAKELDADGSEYEATAYREQARATRLNAEGTDGQGGLGWDVPTGSGW